MKKILIPILMLSLASAVASAQSVVQQNNQNTQTNQNTKDEEPSKTIASTKSSKEMKGDKHYFVYNYNKAIQDYKSSENLSPEGERKLARSYYLMQEFVLSQEAYAKLINKPNSHLPIDYYSYAMALKATGKYAESEQWMDLFATSQPADLRAKEYLVKKNTLSKLQKNSPQQKIVHLDINTDAQDFGTSFYKNQIVFASSRTTKTFPKKSYRNNKAYLNIYVADVSKNQLTNAVAFDKDLNGKMNEGPASFSRNGAVMAYSKNNYNLEKRELIVNVEIYFRTFTDNKWSEPIAFNYNNKEYSVGHPSLTENGNTMYFSSDMPGGSGGADIYSSSKGVNGIWSQPKNLGTSINTEGDEVFPFFEENSNTLYLASDGHFGLGGLDIFSSDKIGSFYSKTNNMGAPFNSASDDFAAIFDSLNHKGYFSSNRPGGKGDDDIYTIEILNTKKIDGYAKDQNNNVLANTMVILSNNDKNNIDSMNTNSDGSFTFNIDGDKNYRLVGHKTDYNDGFTNVNSFGTEPIIKSELILSVKEKEIIKKQEAEPVVAMPLNIKKATVAPKIGELKTIYFDYDVFNIRGDAQTVLNKLIETMNENPSMRIELSSHADCRGTVGYNQNLSDKRAKATIDYIKKGITNPWRVSGKGLGESNQKNNCQCDEKTAVVCSEDDLQENRRTDFVITKIK